VELPKVQVVGLEPPQAVLQVLERTLVVPLAVLGHEEDLVAPPPNGQGLAHDLFAVAVVIVPGVVEERQPLVEGGVHDLDGFLFVLDAADVPAAQADDRHVDARLAQRLGRHALLLGVPGGDAGEAQRQAGCRRGLEELAPAAVAAVVLLTHGGTSSRDRSGSSIMRAARPLIVHDFLPERAE